MDESIHVTVTFLDGTQETFYSNRRYVTNNGLVSWETNDEVISFAIVSIKKIVEQ